jgi:hypothetical protein
MGRDLKYGLFCAQEVDKTYRILVLRVAALNEQPGVVFEKLKVLEISMENNKVVYDFFLLAFMYIRQV